MKDFREKYGIEDNEINDKEIIKYMKKFNNDERKIIEAVLKKKIYQINSIILLIYFFNFAIFS